jgi:hypothetical protein
MLEGTERSEEPSARRIHRRGFLKSVAAIGVCSLSAIKYVLDEQEETLGRHKEVLQAVMDGKIISEAQRQSLTGIPQFVDSFNEWIDRNCTVRVNQLTTEEWAAGLSFWLAQVMQSRDLSDPHGWKFATREGDFSVDIRGSDDHAWLNPPDELPLKKRGLCESRIPRVFARCGGEALSMAFAAAQSGRFDDIRILFAIQYSGEPLHYTGTAAKNNNTYYLGRRPEGLPALFRAMPGIPVEEQIKKSLGAFALQKTIECHRTDELLSA